MPNDATNGVLKPNMDAITYLHPNIDTSTQKLMISFIRLKTTCCVCLFVDFQTLEN